MTWEPFVYAFRIGSRNYPRRIAGPYDTIADAREAAQRERLMGGETGRVRKVSPSEFIDAAKKLQWGVLSEGW